MPRSTSHTDSLSILSFFVLASILVIGAQAQERAHSLHARQASSQSFAVFGDALQKVLWDRGFDALEIEHILHSVGEKLQQQQQQRASHSTAAKRAPGWGSRIALQTRFAPFGTKLVPTRTNGDSTGPSLLRYGRSSSTSSESN